jgi:hypothetical protein
MGISFTSINQTKLSTGEVYCETLCELARVIHVGFIRRTRIISLNSHLKPIQAV